MAHIITVAGATPRIHESVFLAPTAAITGDVEGSTLAQAVRWHAQHRVLADGRRTVVFS